MNLEALRARFEQLRAIVEQLIEKAQNASGEDDFIGIKYSNFSGKQYNLPKTADARSLDKILIEPSEASFAVKTAENANCLNYAFTNLSKNGNGGYFAQLEEVYLPSKATFLMCTFQHCTALTTIHGDLSNIEQITAAFINCTKLDVNALIARMLKLRVIQNNAFQYCTQITEITLPATITSIHSGAFNGCTNVTDVFCPWEEGKVANAPWGMTNATIHYNYNAEV